MRAHFLAAPSRSLTADSELDRLAWRQPHNLRRLQKTCAASWSSNYQRERERERERTSIVKGEPCSTALRRSKDAGTPPVLVILKVFFFCVPTIMLPKSQT